MPQPVSYNTGTPAPGSIQENSISYVVDGQQRDYRGGYSGLSWMSEAPAENNVIFIGNTTNIGRGPANKPLFYPSFNTSDANIIYTANTLPGSPRNLSTVAGAYSWAANNNFFINSANNPIPRIDADGLVLYLNASLPSSYPGTDNTWFDLSGYGNNATLFNGLNSNWNSRGYFEFDGADDYASINYDATSMAAWTGSQTIIFWEYHTFNDGSRRNFWNQAYGGAGTWTHEGGYNINYFYGNSGVDNVPYTALNSTSTPTGRWQMLTTTRDPSQVNWYINNTNTSNMSNPYGVLALTTNNISIGIGYTGQYWAGNIGAIAAYNKALTQAEVNQVYFQSNIVTNNMIYAIDASNLVSYPRSGTTTYPLTGSQTGTLTNGVGYSNSNGGIWSFDGIDDYINLNTDPWTANAFGDDSISIWFKFSSAGVILGQNMNAPFGANGWVPAIYIDTSYQLRTSVFWGGSTGNQTVSPSALLTNTWYNVTVTNEGGTQRTYLNGELIGTLSKTQTSYAGVYYYTLGAARWNGWSGTSGDIGYLQGQIANLYYYNKTLTPSEVQQNYNETKDKFQGQQIVTNGLLLNLEAANKDSYPGTGTTWTNVATNAYNGNLINGPTFRSNQNGGIINLDGVDDYVASSVNSALSNVATVVMLCYGTPSATDRMYCSFGFYDLYYFGSTNNRIMGFNTGNSDIYGVAGISDATISGLTMFTFVFRTDVSYTNNQIWINTTQQSLSQIQSTENAGTRNFTTGNFQIGSWAGGGYYPNIGVLSTLVYNKQLSSTEITQNYNAFRAKFGF